MIIYDFLIAFRKEEKLRERKALVEKRKEEDQERTKKKREEYLESLRKEEEEMQRKKDEQLSKMANDNADTADVNWYGSCVFESCCCHFQRSFKR